MSKSGWMVIVPAILIFALVGLICSPIFTVKAVEVTGNEKLAIEYVKETAGLSSDINIFAFSASKARKALTQDQYIEKVSIVKEWPDKVSLKISERHLSGYVEYMGNYLYIDENGRVLEVSAFFTERLPVIVGLNFSEFNVGQLLQVDDQASFDAVVTLARLFKKYNLAEDVVRVDVSNPENIHIYVYNIDVLFGNGLDADEKVRTLIEILDKLPDSKTIKGFLDMQNSSSPPIFRILT